MWRNVEERVATFSAAQQAEKQSVLIAFRKNGRQTSKDAYPFSAKSSALLYYPYTGRYVCQILFDIYQQDRHESKGFAEVGNMPKGLHWIIPIRIELGFAPHRLAI
jgi:hypothetical protein